MSAAYRKRKKAMRDAATLRDGRGVYTLTGKRHPITGERRKWLAGISNVRGY